MASTKPPEASPKATAREPGDVVVPRPAAGAPPLIVQDPGRPRSRTGLLREAELLAEVGQRLVPLLGCLGRFQQEMADGLADLRDAVPQDSRAALSGRVGQLSRILQWTDAVGEDLTAEVTRTAAGERPVDTTDCLQALGLQIEDAAPGIRVSVSSERPGPVWGRAADLTDLLRLGLRLTALRIGETGTIQVEIEEKAGVVRHRLVGLGDPVALDEPELTERFAELAESCRATVIPDSSGRHGTGMVVGIPSSNFRADRI